MLQKGKRGVGYALLSLERDRKEKVYVSWQPYYDHYVQVKIGRPAVGNASFSEMDTQDLRIIRQCSYCGRFIKIETPAIRAEHDRCFKYFNAKFESVTEKGDSVATIRLNNSSLHHVYRPLNYIDQQFMNKLLQQEQPSNCPESQNPIAQAAYQHAACLWVERFQTDDQGQVLFRQIVNFRQRSFDKLAERIGEFQPAAYQAAARFLQAFRSTESHMQLDRKVILLALLLRTQAHDSDLLSSLLKETGLQVRDLEKLLVITQQFCPELLLWAITWAELFFVHAVE